MSWEGEIVLFYKYVPISDPSKVQSWLQKLCAELGLCGRVLVADEGVNGNLGAASRSDFQPLFDALAAHPEIRGGDIDFKLDVYSGAVPPFPDLAIKLVKEIVSCGIKAEIGPGE